MTDQAKIQAALAAIRMGLLLLKDALPYRPGSDVEDALACMSSYLERLEHYDDG